MSNENHHHGHQYIPALSGENGIKLAKVSSILLTSLGTQYTSGLSGVLLTLSSLGVGHVRIIGPAGLCGLMHSMDCFTNRKYPEVEVIEIEEHHIEPLLVPLTYLDVKIYTVDLATVLQRQLV